MKMRRSMRDSVFHAGLCILACAVGWAQVKSAGTQSKAYSDLAVTYGAERGELAPGNCGCFWLQGGGADAAVTLWKGFGITAALTGENASSNVAPGVDINKIQLMAGPRYTYTAWSSAREGPRFQIFGQGLFGGVFAFNGVFPATSGAVSSASSQAVQAGSGINIFLTPHIGVRVAEADYVRNELPNNGNNTQNDLRLSAGLVFHLGPGEQHARVTLGCSPSSVLIYQGDPLTLTARVGDLEPNANAILSWSGVPGLEGSAATVNLPTGSLAPGTYTAAGTIKEGKPGKEGLKPWETANCSAVFTVQAIEPPTISCLSSPSTIKPGDKSTITATGVSPQNRPLTYNYSAATGTISAAGTSAIFDSTGAPTGAAGITCKVSDDKGQTAFSNISVMITAPYVSPAPKTQALCSISFDMDQTRSTRVDNVAKACLDEVALELQNHADAKAVLVGEATAEEKSQEKGGRAKVEDFAAQRAVNAKDYLVTEKGIDASRISVATGNTDGQTVEDYLVSAGATFSNDVQGTTPVDESTVKPQER
jgi:hypothetical protein